MTGITLGGCRQMSAGFTGCRHPIVAAGAATADHGVIEVDRTPGRLGGMATVTTTIG